MKRIEALANEIMLCYFLSHNITYSEEYQDQFKLLEPDTPLETFIATFGLLEWNSNQLEGLYDNVYRNGLQYAECDGITYVSNN